MSKGAIWEPQTASCLSFVSFLSDSLLFSVILVMARSSLASCDNWASSFTPESVILSKDSSRLLKFLSGRRAPSPASVILVDVRFSSTSLVRPLNCLSPLSAIAVKEMSNFIKFLSFVTSERHASVTGVDRKLEIRQVFELANRFHIRVDEFASLEMQAGQYRKLTELRESAPVDSCMGQIEMP